MALVVFLRGVNVGGHRTVRPSALAGQLKTLGAVSIGAAGTFVIRKRVSRAQLRAEFARRLAFDTEIMICPGSEITSVVAHDFFSGRVGRSDFVRFASVLSRPPRIAPSLPLSIPATGRWFVRILARQRRLLVGVYRREMQSIRYLGTLDRAFGVPATTRSWNTLVAIAKVLDARGNRGRGDASER